MPPSLRVTRRIPLLGVVAALFMGIAAFWMPAPALAIAASGLPASAPQERILDTADVLSRSAIGELSKTLESFSAERVDAHLITVNRLDYGLSLSQLGNSVLERWSEAGGEPNQVLFLIDSQTNSAAVVTSPGLVTQLDASLLRSTARTTMAQPIRDGGRYRQGSLDAMTRLLTVLQGGEDPGEPITAEVVSQPTNIPRRRKRSQVMPSLGLWCF